jgi:hypothetical protein
VESSFLKWYPGVVELSGFFGLLKAINNLLYILLASLFLKQYGPQGLPWVYILSNLFFVMSQMILMKISREKGYGVFSRLIPILMVFTGSLLLLEWAENRLWFLLALLLTMLLDVHSTQAFSDLSSQILPLRESKKYLSTMYAAGTAGSVISGLAIKFLLEFFSYSAVFLGIFLLLFVYQAMHAHLQKFLQPDAPEVSRPSETVASSWFSGNTADHARLLLGISFLAMFSKSLVDFAYTAGLAQLSGSAKNLASFLGIFGAFMDMAVLVLQFFVAGWIFSNVRLGQVLGVRAGGMVLLCLLNVLFPALACVLGLQFYLVVFTKTLVNPAFVLLLEPIPRDRRPLLRKYVSIGDSLANTAGGLVLLLLLRNPEGQGAAVSFVTLFAWVMGLYGVIFLLSRFLDTTYSETVRETLETTAGKEDVEVIRSIRFIPKAHRLARIRDLLENSDQEIRYQAILEVQEFNASETPEVVDMLVTYVFREDSPLNLALISKVLLQKMGPDSVELIDNLLKNTSDPRSMADILEGTTSAEHAGTMTPVLLQYLEHPHHRVRGNAVMGLLKTAEEPGLLEKAMQALREMVRSTDILCRSTAAVVMGTAGQPFFIPALSLLSHDAAPEVTRNSFLSLARIRTPKALEIMAQAKTEPGERGRIAQEIWNSTSREHFVDVTRLLRSLTSQERNGLMVWLKRVKDDKKFDIVQLVLTLPESPVRENLINALPTLNDEMVEVLGKCLSPDDQSNTRVVAEPLLQQIRVLKLSTLPSWAELITLLHVGREPDWEPLALDLVRFINEQTSALLTARENLFWGRSGMDQKCETSVLQRRQVVLHLLALGTAVAPQVLDALGKASGTDGFLQSIALEFLEDKFPRSVSEALFPLLMLQTKPQAFREWQARHGAETPENVSETVVLATLQRSQIS